jgi:hypothetical protein
MNKFNHILIEYDGNIEKPNVRFLEKCRSSEEIYKSYQFSGHYGKGFNRYIFLILEEKRNNWIVENRDKQINKLLEK